MIKHNPAIILSRVDSIGDVVLTLPMAGLIKRNFPDAKIFFLGRTYTKDVVALSKHIYQFINYDELEKKGKREKVSLIESISADIVIHVFPNKDISRLMKRAGVAIRVGTTNRLHHWFNCNKLVRLSRKNSPLHEAQLNLKLLAPLNIEANFDLQDIPSFYGFTNIPVLEENSVSLIDRTKFKVILHPKSKGSAREWHLDNFSKLISLLPSDNYQIFISGTADDAKLMGDFFERHPNVVNVMGKFSLQQFVAFISQTDALVAASTGPLHISAALGKRAIGLFIPRRPMHPGRWQPLGNKATYLVYDPLCKKCADKKECNCIQKIDPKQIVDLLNK